MPKQPTRSSRAERAGRSGRVTLSAGASNLPVPLAPRTPLLTTSEAAKQLAVAKNSLEKMRVRGDGPPFVRVGSAVRYRQSDLDAYIEAGLRTSTS